MESKPIKQNTKLKEDFYRILDRNIVWINSADSKAAIMITFATLLLGSTIFLTEITSIINDQNINLYLRMIISFIGIIYAFSYMSIFAFIFMVFFSRYENNDSTSLLHFANISKLKKDEVIKRYCELTENELMFQLVDQIHITSTICYKKYNMLNRSFVSMLINVFSLIILSVFLSVVI